MIIGTAYFPTLNRAIRYYRDYEDNPKQAVERKLAAGEIHIGRPPLKPGEIAFVRDHRWHIEEVRSSAIEGT